MIKAPGIAGILSGTVFWTSTNFIPHTATSDMGDNPIGNDQVSGGSSDWTLKTSDAPDNHIMVYSGTNPEIQNTTGSSVTIVSVAVSRIGGTGINGEIANITHGSVVLEDGDTIVYTSIEISFFTEDQQT